MEKSKSRKQLAVAIIIMTVFFAASLLIGPYPISLGKLVSGDKMAIKVFFNLRLPRSLMAAVAGFGLSVAGSVYQTIFKNPIASPDIIGVSSGASAGAAAAILFFGGGSFITTAFAFSGGLAAVGAALVLAGGRKQKQLAGFVLSGIAVNALAQSVLMLFKIFADPQRQLASIEYWTMGGLGGITASKLPFVLFFTLSGTAFLFMLHRQIILLSLDADEARMLGLSVNTMRRICIVAATLVVASIVSVTGLISFIGLLAPHISRLISKNNKLSTMALGGVIGAALLLAADCLARSLSGGEIPISVLTSLIGAPFLVYLVRKGDKAP